MDTFAGPNSVQLLFLALKFIQQYDGAGSAVSQLESSLRDQGAFGEVVKWDGSVQRRGMKEIERMFSSVPNNQLGNLLSGSASASSKSSAFRICRPVRWNKSHEEKNSEHEAMRRWSDVLGRMRHLRFDYFRLQCRLLQITKGSIQSVVDPTVDLTIEDSNTIDGSMQSTLRDIGRERVSMELQVSIQDVIHQYENLSSDVVPSVTNELRKIDCLNMSVCSGLDFSSTLVRLDASRLGAFHSSHSNFRREIRMQTFRNTVSPFAQFRLQWTICGHMSNPAYCSVFDQTGNYLLTGADDYLVKIWDVHRGLLVRSCKGHLSYISLIAVSPDNSLFASCCTFGTIRIWRMSDGVCLKMMKHDGSVNWIKFDSSSCALASGGDDGQCIVWDLTHLLPTEDLQSPLLLEAMKRQALLSEGQTMSTHDRELDKDENDVPIGLFDWSNTRRMMQATTLSTANASNTVPIQSITGVLPLPHVSENNGVGIASSGITRVVCLDICTVAGVIVTGSDDAVARIWRFDQPANGDNRYPSRNIRRSFEINRNSYRTSEEYSTAQKHLLLRLEGHIHPVTDVQFNSMGDRVVTGSNLDGTVRIWSMDRHYATSVHLILDLSEQDDLSAVANGVPQSSNQPAVARTNRRGGPRTGNNLKPKVHNVSWTCDDTRIITVQSIAGSKTIFDAGKATRLKVWDAMTGDLLRIIWTISEVTSSCLARHPFDPHFVVTSGEDGFVNVWNIEQEISVSKVKILEEDGKPAEVIDISISNDGTRLAATDKKGRVSFISLDNPEKFKHFMYSSQYFSTDYTEIHHDAEGFAFDVGTQLPLHQAPVGLLCRSDGSAYEIQPPRLAGPPLLSLAAVTQSLDKIEEDRRQLWSEMDRVYEIFTHNKRTNRLRIKYRSLRDNPTHKSNSHDKNSLSKTTKSSTVVYRDIDELPPLSSDDSARDSDYESGHHNSELENDLCDTSSSDSYAGLTLRRSNRAHRPTNYSDAYDDAEDDELLVSPRSMRRSSRSGIRRRQGTYREVSSDDNEDEIGDNGERRSLRRSSRRQSASSRRRNRHIIVDEDDVAAYDHIDSSDDRYDAYQEDEDIDGDATRYSSRGHTAERRAATNSRSASQRGRRGGRSKASSSSATAKRSGSGRQQQQQARRHTNRTEKWIADPSGVGCVRIPVGHEIHRAWLQSQEQYDMLYMPQLGDEVVYIPQGHAKYLESFPEEGLPACNRFRSSPFLECVVQEIRYVFPNQHHYNLSKSVVAIVTLVVTAQPSQVAVRNHRYLATVVEPRSTRRQEQQIFTVSLRSSSCADFVIPKVVFHRALTVSWYPNLPITSHFCDVDDQGHISFQEYAGTVVSVQPEAPEWPLSPWMTLLIDWSSNDSEESAESSLMSFWEVQPCLPSSIARDASFSKMKLPAIASTESAHIAKEISTLVEQNQEEYSVFEYEPDPEVYPEYGFCVPLPMTLSLIIQRLNNNYYRQMAALDHDVDLIVQNCRIYNMDDAPITQNVLRLQREIREIVGTFHTSDSHIPTSSSVIGTEEDSNNVLSRDGNGRKRPRDQAVSVGITNGTSVSKRARGNQAQSKSTSSETAAADAWDAEDDHAMDWSYLKGDEEDHHHNNIEKDNHNKSISKEDTKLTLSLRKSASTRHSNGESDNEDNEEDHGDDDEGDGDNKRTSLKFQLGHSGRGNKPAAGTRNNASGKSSVRLVLPKKNTRNIADSEDEDEEEDEEKEEESESSSSEDNSDDSSLNRRPPRNGRSQRFRLRSTAGSSAAQVATAKVSQKTANERVTRGRRQINLSDEDEEEENEDDEEYDDEEDEDEDSTYKRGSRSSGRGKSIASGKGKQTNARSQPPSTSRGRSTRNNRSRVSYAEEDDDDDDDEEEEDEEEDSHDSDDSGKKKKRRQQSNHQKSSSRGATVRSSRTRRSAVLPDSDEEGEEEEEEEDEEETNTRSRSSRTKAAAVVSAAGRQSQRQSAKKRTSYKDPDSEEDEEEEDDDDDEQPQRGSRQSTRLSVDRSTASSNRNNNTNSSSRNNANANSNSNSSSNISGRSLRQRTSVPNYNEENDVQETPQRRAISAFNSRARQHVSPPALLSTSTLVARNQTQQQSSAAVNAANGKKVFLNADVNDGRRRLTADMKRQMTEIIDFASNLDSQAIFQEPVDTDIVEGYLDIVAVPMDFTTIRTKMRRLDYGHLQELLADICLIYDNCVLFNGDDVEYGRYSMKQKKQFLAYLRKHQIDTTSLANSN